MTLIPYNTSFTGSYGNLVFYYWRGKYCVRTRSTLSGKRVKTAAAFRATMQYAERLGRASVIASRVYRQLPDGWKLHSLFRKMTGLGARLLKQGEQADTFIETALWQYLATVGFTAAAHDMQHPQPGLLPAKPTASQPTICSGNTRRQRLLLRKTTQVAYHIQYNSLYMRNVRPLPSVEVTARGVNKVCTWSG